MDRAIELCEHLTHVLDECTSRPLDQPHPRTFVLESLGKWINSDRDVLSHYLGRMNTGSASPEPREDPKKGTHMEKKNKSKRPASCHQRQKLRWAAIACCHLHTSWQMTGPELQNVPDSGPLVTDRAPRRRWSERVRPKMVSRVVGNESENK